MYQSKVVLISILILLVVEVGHTPILSCYEHDERDVIIFLASVSDVVDILIQLTGIIYTCIYGKIMIFIFPRIYMKLSCS